MVQTHIPAAVHLNSLPCPQTSSPLLSPAPRLTSTCVSPAVFWEICHREKKSLEKILGTAAAFWLWLVPFQGRTQIFFSCHSQNSHSCCTGGTGCWGIPAAPSPTVPSRSWWAVTRGSSKEQIRWLSGALIFSSFTSAFALTSSHF